MNTNNPLCSARLSAPAGWMLLSAVLLGGLAWTRAARAQAPGEPLPPEAYERCGTQLTPESAARMLQQLAEGAYGGGNQIQDIPTIRIRLSAISDANGNNGLTNPEIDEAIAVLNQFYVPLGLHFVETESRRFISSATFIDLTSAQFNTMLDTFNTANTVDVYFVRTLTDPQGGQLNGQATFSTDTSAGVVIVNGATPVRGNNYSTLPHEVGHYFDLLHTHETAFGVECPNELNCVAAGDQVCDTPADPDLTGRVDANCNLFNLPSIPFACQVPPTAYSPATNNIMSYSTVSCRNWITGGQSSRMISAARTLRSDHIYSGGLLAVTWLDFGATQGGSGASTSPIDRLPTALSATQAGGRVVINSSNNNSGFTGTIDQPVTLTSWHGPSTIGR